MEQLAFFWFRRDLRLEDNAALYYALRSSLKVQPVFIFDRSILDPLPKKDKRVIFIHRALQRIQTDLRRLGASLLVEYGFPLEVWAKWLEAYSIKQVYTNHDYEPYAIERDRQVKQLIESKGAVFKTYKDHVIFEKNEVVTDSQKPYTIFTPYKNKWLKTVSDFYLKSYPCENYYGNFCLKEQPYEIPSLAAMGFEDEKGLEFPPATLQRSTLENYQSRRDYPAIQGTSRLGVHLRFGTKSIRKLARHAQAFSATFLSELIWRDFYAMILYHFPYVVSRAFKPEYDNIPWLNNEDHFKRWSEGTTGYPIVDAGMRELNETGYMHNRVRMITASFLTKHLLIDWRWGEAYFAEKLLDFDLASNNGGWQWAVGSGCDAAPYFRVFNPSEQTKKFDPQHLYIRRWVPEYQSESYARPIVDHTFARKRALEIYKEALKQK